MKTALVIWLGGWTAVFACTGVPLWPVTLVAAVLIGNTK